MLLEAITGELISSEIEIISGRGEDLHDALAQPARPPPAAVRARRASAASRSALPAPTRGPTTASSRNIDTEHYRRVVDGLGYVARRNNTFSLHVHVGVRGADRAVRVCDRLRPLLPLLLAVSASSPFLEGHDTRLHSVRSQTFTKSFPRCGVPDAFGSWAAYRDYIQLLIDTGSIVEYTQVWWSVRPHASFGTVEVRIADAQITAAESDALAGLIVACVGQALRDIDEGVPFEDPPRRLIEENFWRAIRHGMDGRMIDFGARRGAPTRAAVDELWRGRRPLRDELRLEAPSDGPNGAQRQRAALHARRGPARCLR